MRKFYGRGKLLLTGEYLVLDGALALAVPTRYGQSLSVTASQTAQRLQWTSLDENGDPWFEHTFDTLDSQKKDTSATKQLKKILRQAQRQNANFLKSFHQTIITSIDFPRAWGLGTSSTLLYAISQWAACNPYELLAKAFGGSGYDIACAGADGPVFYQRTNEVREPLVQSVHLTSSLTDQLYFVYLRKKQRSSTEISRYRQQARPTEQQIATISDLSKSFSEASSLKEINAIIVEHEQMVSQLINYPTIKSTLFADYWGEIKSLGAWGGDFIMATSDRSASSTRQYFNEKGFGVFFKYRELLL